MVRLMRQIARALVGIAALTCVCAANAVTLPSGFHESVAIGGLDNPTAVRFAADGRVFVAEKSGRILVRSSLSDRTPTEFADLSTNLYNFWDVTEPARAEEAGAGSEDRARDQLRAQGLSGTSTGIRAVKSEPSRL